MGNARTERYSLILKTFAYAWVIPRIGPNNKKYKLMVIKAENILCKAALLLAGTATLLSCQKHLVFEDEGNCEDIVEVYLKYDYNIQRADMRPYHVRWANVYAIDEKGNVAAVKTVSPAEAADKNSTVKFDGLQPGRYTFSAMAMQSPYQNLAKGMDARFRATFPAVGAPISDLKVKLDRTAIPGSDAYAVEAPTSGLDTLWMGRSIKPQGIIVKKEEDQRGDVIRDTISLVRDTKYLHLNLHQLDEANRANINHTRYEVEIVDANGHINHMNDLIADQTLIYTPHAAWTTSMDYDGKLYNGNEPEGVVIKERAAHYEISFSRLMFYASAAEGKNALLRIIDKEEETVVVEINLPYYLSQARGWFETVHYSEQEFLDREYDYHLDFFLTNGSWSYVALKINIMPWVMRIQNINF